MSNRSTTKGASTGNIEIEASQQMVKAESARRNLTQMYQNADKVPIKVSPMYAPYFGNVMRVELNGIAVYVPIDGSTHLVSAPFADEVESRIAMIDAIQRRQNKMADISHNAESSPGELRLF